MCIPISIIMAFLMTLDSFSPMLSFYLSTGYCLLVLELKAGSACLYPASAPGVPDLIETAQVLFSAGDFAKYYFLLERRV